MVFLKETSWLTTKLADQTKNSIKELQSGKSAEEIAQKTYMSLGQKNEKVAVSMIKNIKAIIENYHKELLDETKDEKWVDQKLDAMVHFMDSAIDRCKVYYRALTLIGAYSIYYSEDGESTKKAEDFLREKCEYSGSESDAEEQEATLRAQLKQSIIEMNCPLHPTQILLNQVSATEEEFSFPSMVASFGRKSADIKLIMATQAYVNYINGEYNGKEVPLSLDAIVYAVCAGIDYNALEEEPTLRDQILTRLADLLICVLLITMASVVAIILFQALQVMFGVMWGMAVFIFCMLAFCFADFEQGLEDSVLIRLGLSVGEVIKAALLLPYAIFEGAKKMSALFAKNIFNFFHRFDTGGAQSADTIENHQNDETKNSDDVSDVESDDLVDEDEDIEQA